MIRYFTIREIHLLQIKMYNKFIKFVNALINDIVSIYVPYFGCFSLELYLMRMTGLSRRMMSWKLRKQHARRMRSDIQGETCERDERG